MNRPSKKLLLEAHELTKSFKMPSGQVEVLKGVNYKLYAEQMNFIIGRSGSGKSTLLHLLGGLDAPTSGQIIFDGEDLTKLSERALARIRNVRVGFVFQFYHLLPELTVYENVLLPTVIAGKADPKWVQELLRRVQLLSRHDHYPNELSGGEKQRVAIARALVNRPSVVFCDEPTGNLDEETAETVFSLIRDLNEQERQTFVIVTHDESLAWRYPDHVYRLHDGLLMQDKRASLGMEGIS